MHPWLSFLWYEVVSFASLMGMTFGFSLRVEGRRHVPRTGPVLVIANHQSYLDPLLVGVASQRHLRAVARKTLFRNPLFGRLIRGLDAIPIDLKGVAKEGVRAVLEELARGRAILLFPEGTRSADGRVHPFRPGIHLLIKRVQAPIVPVGIAGAFEAWPVRRRSPVFAPLFPPAERGGVAVAVGRPLDARDLARLPREQVLGRLFEEISKLTARAERLRLQPAAGF
jgi:1-acyl-sn-glycerol-3-phosphate acyltransferase